jgi:hypothetical protein
MEMSLGGDMPTHPRKHSDAIQIAEEILKDAAKPRQSASVKYTLENKHPASVIPKTLGGNKGGKTRAAKAVIRRGCE